LRSTPGRAPSSPPSRRKRSTARNRDPTTIRLRLELGADAGLAWLPQETILFDGARLDRRLQAAIAPDARLLIAEMTVLGRTAMGETFSAGALIDHWRVRRDGRLVFAEALRLEGAVEALLAAPCTGAGRAPSPRFCSSIGTPKACWRKRARFWPEPIGEAGASAWNGLLRLSACSGGQAAAVRAAAATLLRHIDKRALPLASGDDVVFGPAASLNSSRRASRLVPFARHPRRPAKQAGKGIQT
jgi:urease accessory protein